MWRMKPLTKIVLAGAALIVAEAFILKVGSDREVLESFRAAQEYSLAVGKPILNLGAGNNPRVIGDINADLQSSILPNYVQVDLSEPLPYPDKMFAAALAFNVLEHLEDPQFALAEMQRVADRVYVVVPHPFNVADYLHSPHRWMFGYSAAYRLEPVKSAAVSAAAIITGLLLIL